MAYHCRENRSDLDHPGDRSPKVGEKFQNWIGFLLRQFVVAVLLQAVLCFDLRETIWRSAQIGLQFCQFCRRQSPTLPVW
jgi:hypothetical protein